MKIKVNKSKLIAAMQEKVKAADAEYKESMDKWKESCDLTVKKWLEMLAEATADIKAKRYTPEYGPQLATKPYWPTKPGKPTTKLQIESLIKKLELVDGEVIDIDDKSDYFSFI